MSDKCLVKYGGFSEEVQYKKTVINMKLDARWDWCITHIYVHMCVRVCVRVSVPKSAGMWPITHQSVSSVC